MKTSRIKEQFKNECQVFELKYEYPGYAGYERYGIITSLSEEKLVEKYPEFIAEYRPYLLLSLEAGEIRSEFIRNQKKHEKRQERNTNIFDFDELTEIHHPEIIDTEDNFDLLLKKELFLKITDALNSLSPIQKIRIIKYYYEEKSLAVIAREEGVNKSAVSCLLYTSPSPRD